MSTYHRSSVVRVLICAGLIATLVSGCASFSSGKKKSSDFSCKGMPEGSVCMDPIEVYESTNGDVSDVNADSMLSTQPASESTKGGKKKTNGTVVPVVVQRNLVVAPTSPKPILEEAQVMRVWVAPFIDANQDLQWPGHIFTEVTPRRWSFGERDVENIRSVVPLQLASGKEESQNQSLPGTRKPSYVPGRAPTTPNPTESIPPGPSYMRDQGPDLNARPYAPGSELMDYN
jgi:conjugal transfer pilus assembly protein TraV